MKQPEPTWIQSSHSTPCPGSGDRQRYGKPAICSQVCLSSTSEPLAYDSSTQLPLRETHTSYAPLLAHAGINMHFQRSRILFLLYQQWASYNLMGNSTIAGGIVTKISGLVVLSEEELLGSIGTVNLL